MLFKCVNSERDLFYVDNTRQVRGVLSGHAKRGGMVVEQIIEVKHQRAFLYHHSNQAR